MLNSEGSAYLSIKHFLTFSHYPLPTLSIFFVWLHLCKPSLDLCVLWIHLPKTKTSISKSLSNKKYWWTNVNIIWISLQLNYLHKLISQFQHLKINDHNIQFEMWIRIFLWICGSCVEYDFSIVFVRRLPDYLHYFKLLTFHSKILA